MDKYSYYVETSVWGMIPKGQPQDMRLPTMQFLRRVSPERCYISSVVLKEIGACKEPQRSAILRVLNAMKPQVLTESQADRELAQHYIASGIVPAKKYDDALHVALCTTAKLDVLVSWNHRHIANERKTLQYESANVLRGYLKSPIIVTPFEVVYE
jgi:hypothetical protein